MRKPIYNWSVAGGTALLAIAFLGRQYYLALESQSEEAVTAGAFARYLLGFLLYVAGGWGVAHLHYWAVYQTFRAGPQFWQPWYWAWLSGLTCCVFLALHLAFGGEPSFADKEVVLAVAIVTGLVAYTYLADAIRARRQAEQLLRQHSQAELDALKAQLNPHFLFNALNTIYNRAAHDQNEVVADLIQQLAGMLRFTLQEAQQPTIGLEKEIGFLQQYLALQRARLPVREGLRVSVQLDWDELPAQIAPLLLLPLVENAFQYGISLAENCWITIDLQVENQQLALRIGNSIASQAHARKGTGQGLVNVRRRLALLYPYRHQLAVNCSPTHYEINLAVDLSNPRSKIGLTRPTA